MDSSTENKICPSATCHPGSLLLGVVQSDRKVALLSTPMLVTEDFVDKAFKAGDPEKRLRFAGKCARSGCSQWTGSRCGVIDEAMKVMEFAIDDSALPQCNIRADCRWFSQNGADACKVCPYVITDTRPLV